MADFGNILEADVKLVHSSLCYDADADLGSPPDLFRYSSYDNYGCAILEKRNRRKECYESAKRLGLGLTQEERNSVKLA